MSNLYRHCGTASKLLCRDAPQSRGGGKIINITSVHKHIPRAGAAGYYPRKGRCETLPGHSRWNLRPTRSNVNNIVPGIVLTPMKQPALDDPEVLEVQRISLSYLVADKAIFRATLSPSGEG